jgi:hypothetical protein
MFGDKERVETVKMSTFGQIEDESEKIGDKVVQN